MFSAELNTDPDYCYSRAVLCKLEGRKTYNAYLSSREKVGKFLNLKTLNANK